MTLRPDQVLKCVQGSEAQGGTTAIWCLNGGYEIVRESPEAIDQLINAAREDYMDDLCSMLDPGDGDGQ